jgi:hypothetical protein
MKKKLLFFWWLLACYQLVLANMLPVPQLYLELDISNLKQYKQYKFYYSRTGGTQPHGDTIPLVLPTSFRCYYSYKGKCFYEHYLEARNSAGEIVAVTDEVVCPCEHYTIPKKGEKVGKVTYTISSIDPKTQKITFKIPKKYKKANLFEVDSYTFLVLFLSAFFLLLLRYGFKQVRI